jgi:uncharacterized protein
MKHFLLLYDYVSDYMEKRAPHRGAHFAHAKPYVDRKELFLAGACTDANDPIGVLCFAVEDRGAVEAFARADPYVLNGIVTAWQVREWTTVVGDLALHQAPAAT